MKITNNDEQIEIKDIERFICHYCKRVLEESDLTLDHSHDNEIKLNLLTDIAKLREKKKKIQNRIMDLKVMVTKNRIDYDKTISNISQIQSFKGKIDDITKSYYSYVPITISKVRSKKLCNECGQFILKNELKFNIGANNSLHRDCFNHRLMANNYVILSSNKINSPKMNGLLKKFLGNIKK